MRYAHRSFKDSSSLLARYEYLRQGHHLPQYGASLRSISPPKEHYPDGWMEFAITATGFGEAKISLWWGVGKEYLGWQSARIVAVLANTRDS